MNHEYQAAVLKVKAALHSYLRHLAETLHNCAVGQYATGCYLRPKAFFALRSVEDDYAQC